MMEYALIIDSLHPAVMSLSQMQSWMEAGGYAVIIVLLCACGLGLPLPEDIPLIISGALAARGKMDLAIASTCCWVGIIGGDCILYGLSRKYGMGITRVPLIGKHITPSRVDWVARLFDRYGLWVVAACRLFAGIRAAMVVAAGATRYSFVKFFVADGIAALFSGGLFIALGYWFGLRLEWLAEEIKRWQHVILGVILGLLCVGTMWYILRGRKCRHEPETSLMAEADVQINDQG